VSQIPFCGATYQGRSVNVNSSRSINLYPEITGAQDDKTVISMVGTPGVKIFSTAPTTDGEVRGLHSFNGKVYTVIYDTLYELDMTTGTYTALQVLSTNTGRVSMADNGLSASGSGGDQLIVVDGDKGWIYNVGTSTASEITDADFLANPTTVVYCDGYFVVINGSMVVQSSDLFAGTAWRAIAIATVGALPDNVKGLIAHNQQLFFIKEYTSEVWYNDGTATTVGFPFTRQSGAVYDYGTEAPWTIARGGGSIFFLATTRSNQTATFYGIVEVVGYQPTIISTAPISYIISSSVNLSDCFGYTYGDEGHLFYVLTKPHTNVTFQDTGDTVTCANHGFTDAKVLSFASIITTTGITAGTEYHVVNPTTNTFQLSLTSDGTPITLTTNGTGKIEDSWTLCYDMTTKMWHERSSFDLGVTIQRHLSNCYVYIGGRHYVGDYRTPMIHEMSSGYYTDNGTVINSIRTAPHIFDREELNSVFISRLDLDIETGKPGEGSLVEIVYYLADGTYLADGIVTGGYRTVGATQGTVYLSWSNDGGNTWSAEYGVSMGVDTTYSTRCVWRRLGQSRNRVFKIRIDSPIKKNIIGAYVRSGL